MRIRTLHIVVDGVAHSAPAGVNTALEVQHALRHTGKSVRVIEHYVGKREKKEKRRNDQDHENVQEVQGHR